MKGKSIGRLRIGQLGTQEVSIKQFGGWRQRAEIRSLELLWRCQPHASHCLTQPAPAPTFGSIFFPSRPSPQICYFQFPIVVAYATGCSLVRELPNESLCPSSSTTFLQGHNGPKEGSRSPRVWSMKSCFAPFVTDSAATQLSWGSPQFQGSHVTQNPGI